MKTLSAPVLPSYGATDVYCKHLVQLPFHRFLLQQSGDCLCCHQGHCLCLLTPVSQHFASCLGQGRGSIEDAVTEGRIAGEGAVGSAFPDIPHSRAGPRTQNSLGIQ